MSSSARRTAACGNPITTTETRISSRRPSRQTTQPVLLYALAVGAAAAAVSPSLVFPADLPDNWPVNPLKPGTAQPPNTQPK